MQTLENIYDYVKGRLHKVGTKVLYTALLLFYAYQRKDIPGWCRHIITGAIAYLLTPIDAVPDLTPILGYTDDFSVLAFALVNIAGHVNEDIRTQAKDRLQKWVKVVDEQDVAEVDRLI